MGAEWIKKGSDQGFGMDTEGSDQGFGMNKKRYDQGFGMDKKGSDQGFVSNYYSLFFSEPSWCSARVLRMLIWNDARVMIESMN